MRPLVEAARGGSIRAASRLISRLEDDPALAPELFAELAEWPWPRLVVGLTGPPGAGKSTLAGRLLSVWRGRHPDKRLGVIAVDPSSPFTGGAVLGDRIRMMTHATDENIFIRSLANRGHLGGLTLGIKGSLRVMGLVGCDIVLLETVGVGQGEVEIIGAADLTVVVLAPGHGDGVQLLKAGLLEIGNLFVVNKGDRPGADALFGALTAMLRMAGGRRSGAGVDDGRCLPPASMTSPFHAPVRVADPSPDPGAEVFLVRATDGQSVEQLADGIERQARLLEPGLAGRRRAAIREEVRQAILEAVGRRVEQASRPDGWLDPRVADVLAGRAAVAEVAGELLRAAAGECVGEARSPGAAAVSPARSSTVPQGDADGSRIDPEGGRGLG